MAVSDKSKKPARTKATSAGEWRKSASQLPLVETPTGKWIRLKRPGMTKFLEAGYLPDALAEAVRKEISSASRKKVDPKKLIESIDGDVAVELLATMDRIICSVMVEPKVVSHKRKVDEQDGNDVWEEIPEDERRDDVVYTDEIDQEDKNFIFSVASGGSTDLTRFRAEQAAVVDVVSTITAVEEAPERASAPGS